MFVLLILAFRYSSHQSKEDSKGIIADNLLSNVPKPNLLGEEILDGLQKITNRSGWSVTASSWQADNGKGEGPPKYIIDSNESTLWHSRYNWAKGGSGNLQKSNFYFIVYFNDSIQLGGFQYGPRRRGSNGRFTNYNLYTGNSREEVERKIRTKNRTAHGTLNYPSKSVSEDQFVRLNGPVSCTAIALETNGTPQGKGRNRFFAAACTEFYVYVYPKNETESPTVSEIDNETESPTVNEIDNETESPTVNEIDNEMESETEIRSQNEIENETEIRSQNEIENETNMKNEGEKEIENPLSEAEESNINQEKVKQTESYKEEQEPIQSSKEKDDDRSQPDIQNQTSLETKTITSNITGEIIPPHEETNGPSNRIIMPTKEITSNTPPNSTNIIDNTKSEIERDSSIESRMDSEDSKNITNTVSIASVATGAFILLIIVIVLIIYIIHRNKRLDNSSVEVDLSVEMDDGALTILETKTENLGASFDLNQNDIAENPFMKDDFVESNNTLDNE
ncbi:hypothetical protein TRFO_40174 [Tritrichomonas foetus]|uniref:F5/8 type C domain-containing protein n=1 Tax=Tritrichomonas foetus TaxID=1144522 RepID=A0A1J4J822_9EUKA|nr:hypothetical protein TRFO_40174 [Tritrichomonas foetus]|eukprot:OHS93565.1 hypothetical protein TRFO_40174 [Tritrichomonas foetus]